MFTAELSLGGTWVRHFASGWIGPTISEAASRCGSGVVDWNVGPRLESLSYNMEDCFDTKVLGTFQCRSVLVASTTLGHGLLCL